MLIPKFIKSIARHCEKGDRAYSLNCVRFENQGGLSHTVASDGKQLVCVTQTSDGDPEDALLGAKALAKAAKGKELTLEDATKLVEPFDGRFPQWRDVFKIDGEYTGSLVDATLLKKFCDTVIEANKGGKANIRLWIKDEHTGMVIAASSANGSRIRGVLMPLANDNGDPAPGVHEAMKEVTA